MKSALVVVGGNEARNSGEVLQATRRRSPRVSAGNLHDMNVPALLLSSIGVPSEREPITVLLGLDQHVLAVILATNHGRCGAVRVGPKLSPTALTPVVRIRIRLWQGRHCRLGDFKVVEVEPDQADVGAGFAHGEATGRSRGLGAGKVGVVDRGGPAAETLQRAADSEASGACSTGISSCVSDIFKMSKIIVCSLF